MLRSRVTYICILMNKSCLYFLFSFSMGYKTPPGCALLHLLLLLPVLLWEVSAVTCSTWYQIHWFHWLLLFLFFLQKLSRCTYANYWFVLFFKLWRQQKVLSALGSSLSQLSLAEEVGESQIKVCDLHMFHIFTCLTVLGKLMLFQTWMTFFFCFCGT